MKLSLTTTCMGRAYHLKQTLPQNLADSVNWSRPDDVEFLVLDYSSPDDLAEWITTDPQLRPYLDAGILRFAQTTGQTHYRFSHSKNMAEALAHGDFTCNVDADNFVGRGFTDYLRAVFTRHPNAIVSANRVDPRLNAGVYKGCMGRIALSKANFERLGGYDESPRFRGWAAEDADLVIRAIRMFMRPVVMRQRRFLRTIEHTDQERIELTDFDDAHSALATVQSLNGTRVRPILKYVLNRAVAPRKANVGHEIGVGDVSWYRLSA